MKPIKITKENTNKIAEAITTAEGKARVRTITAEDVFKAVDEVEAHLNLPQKYLKGIRVWCDSNSQPFPACYNGGPQSTQFKLVRRSVGWYITDIVRYNTNRSCRYEITLTAEAKEYIRNKAIKNASSF